jgi:hypothetical protein
MTTLRAFVARLLSTFGIERVADLDEEVRAHLEMQAQEYERGGMTPEAARAAALERDRRHHDTSGDQRTH